LIGKPLGSKAKALQLIGKPLGSKAKALQLIGKPLGSRPQLWGQAMFHAVSVFSCGAL